jgi:hypothetical protein
MTVPWKFPVDKVKAVRAYKRPKTPAYYFIVTKDGNATLCRFISDTADLTGTLKISLVDDKGAGVGDTSFNITFGNKTFKNNQKTTASGTFELKNIPLGEHSVVFTSNPLVTTGKPAVLESPVKPLTFPLSMLEENKFVAGTMIVRCSHENDGKYRYVVDPPGFGIVETRSGAVTEPDTVSIYSSKKYNFTCNNSALVSKKESIYNRYDLQCKHPESGDPLPVFSPRYWSWLNKEVKYEITGGPKPLVVKVYPAHEYTLSVSFPTPKVFEGGAKFGEKVIENIEDKIKTRMPKQFKFQPKPADMGKWKPLEHPLALASNDRPIAYAINGHEVTLSALDAIGSILTFYKKINSIIDLIKQKIPEAGWYFKFENKFFEGKIALVWGWKEYSDHRAYVGVAASVELTIVSVTMEIGIGFDICNVVGQIYGSIAGEIKVTAALERVSPDWDTSFSIPFSGNIDVTLGARVKAGTLIRADALATMGINFTAGKFSISSKDGTSVSMNAKFSGIKAKVAVSSGIGKVGGQNQPTGQQAETLKDAKEWVWVKESELGKFAWPSEEKYEPAYMTSSEIKDIFEKVFTDWANVVIYDSIGLEVSRELVIDKFVKAIDRKKDLQRSKKVIDAIARKVRVDLKNSYVKVNGSNGVQMSKVNNYISNEFAKILDGNIDQSLQLMNKLD